MGRRQDFGRESASLLATAVVLLLGFIGSVFIVSTSVDDPLLPLLAVIAIFAFLLISSFANLRVKNDGAAGTGLLNWFKARKPAKMPDYSPRRVKTSSRSGKSLNAPPSADDVREIQETSSNTWVPSGVPDKKS